MVRPKQKRPSWIYFLFFFSGISGLIYQIVWTRMLTLVFGHTIYSVSVVLSAFMAGLGLGSYLWGTTIDKTGKPLLIYGKIELLIGVTAALLSLLFSNFSPIYVWLYQWLPDSFFLTGLLKTALAFSLVLIPTIFMGATLPIMAKYFVTEESHTGKQVGYLYAINTFGAAAGCLLAGYFLIEHLGVLQTAWLAATVNIIIGIICVITIKKSEPETSIRWDLPKPASPSLQVDRENIIWIATSFLCGFTALAYEVVWTRILVFGIGSTVYSFSLMLANFLFGITVGGLLIVPFFKRKFDFRLLLILFQFGIGFYLIFSLYQSNWLLSSFTRPLRIESPVTEFWIDMRNASSLMLLPTILFGMSFPVLTHLVTKTSQNIGSSLGIIYGINTLGGILGSLVAGYLLLPNFGSQQTLSSLALLNLLTGILLFATSSYFAGVVRKGMAFSLFLLFFLFLIKMPDDLLKGIFMRNSLGQKNPEKLIYLNEGLTTTVAVFNDDDEYSGTKQKSLILNGINMSANNIEARRYMTLLSYLPLLLTDNPKDVLVICFGTGLTSGAAGVYPGINSVDAVDISPGVFRSAKLFSDTNFNAVNNPKVHKIVQDGRNHLLTTSKTYDVITAEPPPPTQAGAVNLYTKEYYELTKKSLKPGGVVSQWIPLHSQTATHIYEHFRTFLESFPYAMGWYPASEELILIGSNNPINIDFDQIKKRMQDPAIKNVMGNAEFQNPFLLLGNIWLLEKEIQQLGLNQNLISDNNPSLEFFLGSPQVSSKEGVEKILISRVSFETILKRISPLTDIETETFKKHWDDRLRAEYAENFFDLGVSRIKEKNLKEAISNFREAVRLNPNNVLAQYNLGNSLVKTGNLELAEEHFRNTIKLKPNYAVAYNDLGYTLAMRGKLDEAMDNYRTAIEVKPDYASAYINMGISWDVKGEFDKAIEQFQKAIKFQRENAKAYLALGNTLYNKKNLPQAILHYKTAIRLKPDYLEAKNNLKLALQPTNN